MAILSTMKPNNAHTSPEQRFFYPVNHEIEHHGSLDTDNLPGVESLGGADNYAVIETPKGETLGVELYWQSYNIRAGSRITGLKSLAHGSKKIGNLGRFVDEENFKEFDQDISFSSDANQQLSVIAQVDVSRLPYSLNIAEEDSRFSTRGVAILPQNKALPTFEDTDVEAELVKYRLLGFISPEDKLITWQGPMSHTALLVDWSVASVLKQNRLEEALLHDALPLGGHLVGMLSINEAASTYLQYYDEKHGTHFMPEKDPRHPIEENFPRFSEKEYATYRKLAELAHGFMTNPR